MRLNYCSPVRAGKLPPHTNIHRLPHLSGFTHTLQTKRRLVRSKVLREQIIRIRDLNPDLKAYVYHAMASPNPSVKEKERKEFLEYMEEFKDDMTPLNSIGFYRKAYRDVIPEGKSVLEADNAAAKSEIESLMKEVF